MMQVNQEPDIIIASTWTNLSVHYKNIVYMQIN